MDLVRMKCIPCEGGVKPMGAAEARKRLKSIKGWKLERNRYISKEFRMEDFRQAMKLVNKAAAIAEKEGHHPDISIYGYKNVRFTLSTHAIDGLSVNDFIIAAKIDSIKL